MLLRVGVPGHRSPNPDPDTTIVALGEQRSKVRALDPRLPDLDATRLVRR